MKKKKWKIGITVICIAILAVGAIYVFGKKDSDKNKNEGQSAEVSDVGSETGADGESDQLSENASAANGEISPEALDEGNAVMEDNTDSSAAESSLPDGSAWRDSIPAQGTDGTENHSAPENDPDNAGNSSITFPYTIPNTGLTIQNIASYDGVFLEDGSDVEVTGIASAVLENSGGSNVEYAKITLSCDGNPLVFEVSDIAAGSSVVAQEVNKTGYQVGTYTDCTADVAQLGEFEMSGDRVKVEENEDGSLTVSNLTGEEIPCVRVFYKFYMNEENVYVGGITYTAKLTNLGTNGSQKVTPSHYSAGYSRVVMVRTYDTAD